MSALMYKWIYCTKAVDVPSVLFVLSPFLNAIAPRVHGAHFELLGMMMVKLLKDGNLLPFVVVTLYNINPPEALTRNILLESCIEIERGLCIHVDALAHK